MNCALPGATGIRTFSRTLVVLVWTLLLPLGIGNEADAKEPGVARLEDAGAVPHVSSRGQEGYRQFLNAENHRAFAVAPGGSWGWSQGAANGDLALEQALQTCQQHSRQRCVPYALDQEVVFDARGWARLWQPYATAAEAAKASIGTDRGQRFPDLRLDAPNGKPLKLSSLRGQVVVLHFWGTWCPTCRRELPQFEQLQRSFASRKDLAFIFTQAREPADTARTWLKQQGVHLALHDSGARSSRDDHFRLSDGQTLPDRQVRWPPSSPPPTCWTGMAWWSSACGDRRRTGASTSHSSRTCWPRGDDLGLGVGPRLGLRGWRRGPVQGRRGLAPENPAPDCAAN